MLPVVPICYHHHYYHRHRRHHHHFKIEKTRVGDTCENQKKRKKKLLVKKASDDTYYQPTDIWLLHIDCDKRKGKNLRGVKVALLLLTSNGYERVLPLPFLALLSRPNSRTLVGADAPVRGVPERVSIALKVKRRLSERWKIYTVVFRDVSDRQGRLGTLVNRSEGQTRLLRSLKYERDTLHEDARRNSSNEYEGNIFDVRDDVSFSKDSK
ncbi:hypothetical protein V1478_009931 [Vespula squamosa]|uniref:Uncharacterized protein n=1 Tax=Vespula squamosa TaxID=30214 RepID=A0ABD2AK03_VESSQ